MTLREEIEPLYAERSKLGKKLEQIRAILSRNMDAYKSLEDRMLDRLRPTACRIAELLELPEPNNIEWLDVEEPGFYLYIKCKQTGLDIYFGIEQLEALDPAHAIITRAYEESQPWTYEHLDRMLNVLSQEKMPSAQVTEHRRAYLERTIRKREDRLHTVIWKERQRLRELKHELSTYPPALTDTSVCE